MGLSDSLDHARPRVEATLLDSCTIVGDQAGARGDVFNLATGLWERSSSARGETYSGRCSIRYVAGATMTTAGQEIVDEHWEARITIGDSEAVAVGQTLTLDDPRDQSLAGASWRIVGVGGGSFALTRKLILELQAPTVRVRAGF